jgi:adenylate cyclase
MNIALPPSAVTEAARPLVDWLVSDARLLTRPQSLVAATCARLVDCGVPLDIFNAWVFLLHPEFFGVSHRWERATGTVESNMGSHEIFDSDQVQNSPLQLIRRGQTDFFRQHLCAEGAGDVYPVMQDYLDAGCTDYIAMAMPSTDGNRNSISFATRAEGGFTDEQIAIVAAGLPHMAHLTELQATRYLATVLLDTYVGQKTGAEILSGNILRGHGRTLHAVILMTDLQGFTALSNSLPRDTLIGHLNAYFDAFGGPVQAEGGEILKFIGDAMLAIFPVDDGNAADRAAAALRAVRAGFATIDALNAERQTAGMPAITCGAALHVGDVMYGNVGAANRLDFTVIGPAVNLAARIEGLTRPLGERLLLSADFAALSADRTETMGLQEIKGMNAVEVFRVP